MILALKYRPLTFADTTGQRHILPVLKQMVRAEDVPPAMLFAGTRGTGKTTTARVLAAALNCEDKEGREGDSCAQCPACISVQSSSSFAVLEIDAASNNGIDDIRKIKEMVSFDTAGDWRVVLLDEAHSLSRAAFNALLKVLEEPPPRTTFVLLTTEANRIPETVASRAMAFEFRRLTIADLKGRLTAIAEAEEIPHDEALLLEIASRSQGGMRDAVMALDQCSRVSVSDVVGFRDLFGIYNVAVPLLGAAATADFVEGTKLIDDYFYRVGDAQGMVTDLVSVVGDLIVLKSGGKLTLSDADIEARENLSAAIELRDLINVVSVLWELKSRTRAVDNDHRTSMEMAFVLITNALHPDAAAGPIHEAGTTDRPLTKEEMAVISARFREEVAR